MKKLLISFSVFVLIAGGIFAQTEADFIVELTGDGTGVLIKQYTGRLLQIRIPATIQGMPVKIIGTGNHGEYVLPYNLRATSVIIPEGVQKINNFAFQGFSSISNLVIPNSVTEIGYGAISGTGIVSFSWPQHMTIIPDSTFQDCTKLSNMIIPEGITEVGEGAFDGCTSLTSISFPSTIKKIGRSAFSGCYALASVIIPDSVSTIEFGEGGAGAFYNCPRIPLATQAALKRRGYNGSF